MQSLGMVSDGLSRPPVESISGLSPSISIDQHLTNHSPRSTVGTSTEVYTYLRVLFARLGQRPCPQCGKDVPPRSYLIKEDEDFEEEAEEKQPETYACPHCAAELPEMIMANFSFNKPEGACPPAPVWE